MSFLQLVLSFDKTIKEIILLWRICQFDRYRNNFLPPNSLDFLQKIQTNSPKLCFMSWSLGRPMMAVTKLSWGPSLKDFQHNIAPKSIKSSGFVFSSTRLQGCRCSLLFRLLWKLKEGLIVIQMVQILHTSGNILLDCTHKNMLTMLQQKLYLLVNSK